MFDRSFFDAVPDRSGTYSIKYGTPPPGAPADTLPLWVADMDFPSPPAVRAALERAPAQAVYGYTAPDDTYWDAIAAWIARRLAWQTERDWFVGIPNLLSGVAAAIDALSAPGDAVLLLQPVYYPFARIITGRGRRLVVSELREEDGRYTMDLADVERKLEQEDCRLLLLCSPHNPVGRVWTRGELNALGTLCLRRGVRILSDEIHADLVFTKHTPIASLSPELAAITVTAMAPTKTFNVAGLPAAHLIVPDAALRRDVRRACGAAGHGAANLMALAAARAAYTQGEDWLEGLLAYLRENRDLLARTFPVGAPVVARPVEGTYLSWLDCRALGLGGEQLGALFLQGGLWLDGGTMFGAGGEGFMRLNFACPRVTLEEAIRRIRRIAGM